MTLKVLKLLWVPWGEVWGSPGVLGGSSTGGGQIHGIQTGSNPARGKGNPHLIPPSLGVWGKRDKSGNSGVQWDKSGNSMDWEAPAQGSRAGFGVPCPSQVWGRSWGIWAPPWGQPRLPGEFGGHRGLSPPQIPPETPGKSPLTPLNTPLSALEMF